ncbi:MAG: GNAT family N-acetyltransferase [Bdellovibrionota bacterium]
MSKSIEPQFRIATQNDLPQILHLLADDELGRTREAQSETVGPEYQMAFTEIESDANNELIVGIQGSEVIAVLQITYIPNLTLKGTKRAQIEGVRVSSKIRGQGVGQKLFNYAIQRARNRGCKLAQLTTNKSRNDAIRFYENLGFVITHEGMKLQL